MKGKKGGHAHHHLHDSTIWYHTFEPPLTKRLGEDKHKEEGSPRALGEFTPIILENNVREIIG
jgi:hypothetical protein